jgi:hypothetical protein
VLVPGKTPPDASGSRPDSRYGKSSDVGRPPFRSTRPQGEMRQPPVGSATTSLWEMGRSPSTRFLTKPAFTARFPLSDVRRFTSWICCCDGLREEPPPTNMTHRAAGSLATAVLGPTDPGGTGRPGSADLVKRKAFRPALLLRRSGVTRLTKRPASFRRPSAGADVALTSLHR